MYASAPPSANETVSLYDPGDYERQLRRLFSRCDLDGNGILNKREIIKVCRQDPEVAQLLGLPSHIRQEDGRAALEQFFQGLDLDGNREISWVEFYQWFSSHPFVSDMLRTPRDSNLPLQKINGSITAEVAAMQKHASMDMIKKPHQLRMMMVTVPQGAEPGQLIQFRAPDSTMMQVSVPENERPGNEFQVQISQVFAADGLVVTLTVPEGVEPGQIVLFDAPDGTCMRVFVPEGRAPGAEFQVILAPPTAQLKLIVPQGMCGGEDLEFQAPDGAQMRTQVPNGLKEGDQFLVNVRRPAPTMMGSAAFTKVASGPSVDKLPSDQTYNAPAVSGGAGPGAQPPSVSNDYGGGLINPSPDSYRGLGQLCSLVGAGNLEAVKRCIADGVSVNGVYDAGFTPLFYAAIDGHPDVAQFLLDQRADVMARNNEQRTPLHWAARCGHVEVVNLLLAARADMNVEDGTGRTPLALARQKGQPETAAILEDAEKYGMETRVVVY